MKSVLKQQHIKIEFSRRIKNLFKFSNRLAYKQIYSTIKHNRWLFASSIASNLLAAALETATLGTIFIALGILEGSRTPGLPKSIASLLPTISTWVNNLENQTFFLSLVGVIVLLQLARSLMIYISQVTSGDLTAQVQAQMTESIFAHILSFSFPCASRYKIGDLTSYVTQAGNTINVQMRGYSQLLTQGSMVAAYGVTVLAISAPLSAIALLLFTTLVFFQKWLLPRIRRNSTSLIQAQVDVAKDIVENVQALRVIHTFGYQIDTIEQVKGLQQQVLTFLQRQARLMAILLPLNNALTILMVAALLVSGSLLLDQGEKPILPALATFIVALNRLSVQLQGAAGIVNQLATNSGEMSRLNEVLQVNDKEFSREGGETFTGLCSYIQFDCVSLKYNGAPKPALQDISFKIRKNSVTALVGESGAGKSSIADLLVGLYEPSKGQILVDGFNLSSYNLRSWRNHIGVVSQDTFIFNQSILENIRYGLPQATTNQVKQAAEMAQAHHFIKQLPQGYETVVGERGYQLSGGQRQRIALARAILKDPEILILDEATSALDSHSERLVQEALGQFSQDRTVLVIAHRLSTIVKADEILVLDQGQIVEQGTHKELIDLSGKYARYWHIQSTESS